MLEIENFAQLRQMIGNEVAVSAWTNVSQIQVNQFAEATGDKQWIHVDVERSRRDLPNGGTIAHGFLTLALLPKFFGETVHMNGINMLVNYGLNRVRFPAPLPVGSNVRGRFKLLDVEDIAGGAQVVWQVTIEYEGGRKPVCVAESILRCYP